MSAHVPPEQWRSVFQTVDRTDAAADLLEYSEMWRTPDGAERMAPLTKQQAQTAVDTVFAFLNDRINRSGQAPAQPDQQDGDNRG